MTRCLSNNAVHLRYHRSPGFKRAGSLFSAIFYINFSIINSSMSGLRLDEQRLLSTRTVVRKTYPRGRDMNSDKSVDKLADGLKDLVIGASGRIPKSLHGKPPSIPEFTALLCVPDIWPLFLQKTSSA